MISKEQFHTVLGLMTLIISRRKQLDETEKSASLFLRSIGAKDSDESAGMQILDWVGEATYNSGDDPEDAARQLLRSLELEVEE